jgi:hypothetical protein
MSVFKKIDVNDNSITPFNVYKDYNITPFNYSGSGGLGVQFLSALYHSHSFGDPIHGRHISDEPKNPNGTYKSIIHDSLNHMYYQRIDKPSENFGGNNPAKETRELGDTTHVISVPSTLFDLRIKSGSVKITDGYIRSMPISYERCIDNYSGDTTYKYPVILTDQYKFESSQSKYVNSVTEVSELQPARYNELLRHQVVTGSGNDSLSKVGTGSMLFKVDGVDDIGGIKYNAGLGVMLRSSTGFRGKSANQWQHSDATKVKHGMPVYNITMWVKPPDPGKMPNGVTGAPGKQTLITRDRNSYFELNIITGSLKSTTYNPKGLVPLQMFYGATGSNCTTSESRDVINSGFGLATGSWNLVNIQQEFWPPSPAFMGTSGSLIEHKPPWGHSPAKTTLRIYRPDPDSTTGYTYIKKTGFATASKDLPNWTNLTTRAVTSSIQYNRNCYIGASGSVAVGAEDNNPTSNTILDAFTGSIDDVRIYESVLTDTHIHNLVLNAPLDLRRTPPVTASFDIVDDGFGNLQDNAILSSSFFKPKNLVGYYGFNDLYTLEGRISSSSDQSLHDGLGRTSIKDFSDYKNHGISDKVKFIPGISIQQQSGSIRSANSINYYQTSIPTGIRASFNNSGSIKVPHIPELNLENEKGFSISFWIKIPENQIPGLNTITGSGSPYPTTGIGGDAGGTSEPCVNYPSGSTAGRDYITLITKSGLSVDSIKNLTTGQVSDVILQGKAAEMSYPYHIELKNTSRERNNKPFEPGNGCPQGAPINTVVVRRRSLKGNVFLESKSSLTPLIENHVVVTKTGNDLSIWINGKLDNRIVDNLDCTGNMSDLFIGDTGRSWITGSLTRPNIESNFITPKNPFSGSLDEIRFYDTPASEENVLSLYDNNLNSPTAYQSNYVGNVFYEHGMLTITNNNLAKFYSGSLHQGSFTIGNNVSKWDDGGAALFSNKFSLKFKNSRELYEQKILCHAKASDFNLTTNPTARKNTLGKCDDILSVQELADFATKPEFNPYITTVGLYDDFGRLLAIAKLAKPIPKLSNVDMTFVVKFDR